MTQTESTHFQPVPPTPVRSDPRTPQRVPLWTTVGVLVAGIVGATAITYLAVDDSSEVGRLTDRNDVLAGDLDDARGDAFDAQVEADEARQRAGQAREEGYDSGYFDGSADGYYQGYDQGWRDGVDPFEPYSPDDNVTGVA